MNTSENTLQCFFDIEVFIITYTVYLNLIKARLFKTDVQTIKRWGNICNAIKIPQSPSVESLLKNVRENSNLYILNQRT